MNSWSRAHCDWCHVETRTEHDLKRWLTDSRSKTCESGDAQPVQGGNFFIKYGISSQSGEWRLKKKSRPGTRKLDARWFKIGSRKFSSEWTREGSSSRQETGAERSNPNKEWREPSRHEETCCMLTLGSETWNTQTIDTRKRSFKIWRRCWECLQSTQHFQCFDMEIVFSFVDESRHPLWSRFVDEFGNLQEHKKSKIFGVYSTLLGSW